MNKKGIFNIQETKVMYNAQGRPEFVLVPIKQAPIYDITDSEIVAAVGEMREELTQKYDAQASASAR